MFESFIQYLISNQVPVYTILVLLYIPIVTTLVTISRYIVGWKSLSIYSTVLLVFALLEIARIQTGASVVPTFDVVRGLVQGGALVVIVTAVAFLLQGISRDIRLHYLSRVSIIMTIVTVVVFVMLSLAIDMGNIDFLNISPVALIIMILVLDIFTKSYIRRGRHKAIFLIANTIGLSFLIFAIISHGVVVEFILKYPIIIFLLIILNVIVGRWRQLRLSEYFRFRDINIKSLYDNEHDSEQK